MCDATRGLSSCETGIKQGLVMPRSGSSRWHSLILKTTFQGAREQKGPEKEVPIASEDLRCYTLPRKGIGKRQDIKRVEGQILTMKQSNFKESKNER